MKKILSIILLMFSFIVLGCEKEISYIEFKTDNIIMEYDSKYKVEYEVFGEVENILFSVENEDIVTFENDVLTSHKEGNTKLVCTYNTEDRVEINIQVLPFGEQYFEVKDSNENQVVYDSLLKDMDDFSNKINEHNQFILNLKVEINDESSSQSIKAMNEPLYLEFNDGYYTNVIAQENDKVFSYIIDGFYVERSYLDTYENYILVDDKNNSDEMLETEFNKDKCSFTKEGNTYTFLSYYGDMINDESKQMIDEMFMSIGLSSKSLYKTVVTTTYIFLEDKLYMSSSLVYKIGNEYEHYELYLKVIYEIELKNFTPINIFNDEYIISAPRNFEEVYEEFTFGESISFDTIEKNYYLISVDKGTIFADSEEIRIELFDMDKKLVSSSMANTGRGSYTDLDSFAKVPEKGMYYMVISNRTTEERTFKVYYYQYETVYSDEGIDLATIDSYEGEIEGKYDFERFVYNNTGLKEKTIRIENTGDETIAYYHNKKWYSVGVEFIKPNEAKYIKVDRGENEIYLCGDFMSSKEFKGYKYSFNVEILAVALDGEIIEGEIPKTFTLESFKSKYYYTYLDRGMYKLSRLSVYVDDSMYHYINVYSKDGEKSIFSDTSPYFHIEESGYYFVGVTSNYSQTITLNFSKYVYDNDEENNNLDVSGLTSNQGVFKNSSDCKYYFLENDTKKIKVYCITNMSSDSLVLIFKQHKDVDYEKHTIEKEGKIYFASNPGKMDFIVCSNSSTSEYNFLVEEMENNNADSRISNNLVQLKDTYTEKYYMFGLALPPAYFKVVVEKDGYIVLSFISGDEKVNKTLNIEVKNEYGVQYSSYSKVPAGTYYVAVSSYGYDFIYARVKCEIKAYL